MKKLSAFVFCFLFAFMTAGFAEMPGLAETPDFAKVPADYALTFFRKFNETQKKLTYMNKPGSLEKVGTETVSGNISGTIFYDVKVKGLGADVILRYTNYCDEEGWTFDGEILTYSNMAQNGYFEGTIKITGIAPGEVCYDKVIMKKGAPGEGFYLVSFSGKTAVPVDYSMYQKSKE